MKLLFKCLLISVAVSLVSCEKNLLEEEYYKNVVYLKSGENNIYPYIHRMNDSVSRGFLTLGSGGSMPLTEDVVVTLEVDETILDEYNHRNYGPELNKYVRMVNRNLFVLPSYQITLKRGDINSTTFFPVEIDANELSPDTTYMIPFRIKTSSGGELNPDKTIVLYRPQLENSYSSPKSNTYKMKGTKLLEGATISTSITTTKTMVPLGRDRVRIFPENIASSTSLTNILNNTIVLVVNDDNSVNVKPFKNILVEQIGESAYHHESNAFVISYRYKLPSASSWVTVKEILTRVD